MTLPFSPPFEHAGLLTQRLSALHRELLAALPCVDGVACALYDAPEGRLRAFLHSTRSGQGRDGYQLPGGDALSLLAARGGFRVLDEIAAAIDADPAHAQWRRAQGYHASFAAPLYDRDRLLGFVFFDSVQAAAFTPGVQRDLLLFSGRIATSIAGGIAAVQRLAASARVACELAKKRDVETGLHQERIGHYARLIAQQVAPARGRDEVFVERVGLFAPLHDIGKIAVPDRVLHKPGRLSPAERTVMQGHVDQGVAIIEDLLGHGGFDALPEATILQHIVRCHHEFLDGSGYPRGLRGEAVPLEARIVTVADIFDALTASRPYKRVWSADDAFAELAHMVARGQLDADCVEALRAQAGAAQAIQRSGQPASVG